MGKVCGIADIKTLETTARQSNSELSAGRRNLALRRQLPHLESHDCILPPLVFAYGQTDEHVNKGLIGIYRRILFPKEKFAGDTNGKRSSPQTFPTFDSFGRNPSAEILLLIQNIVRES